MPVFDSGNGKCVVMMMMIVIVIVEMYTSNRIIYIGWLKGRGPVIDTDGESALWTNSSRQLTQINSGERGVTTSVLLRPHTAAQSHWSINYSLFFHLLRDLSSSLFLSIFHLLFLTIISLSWINQFVSRIISSIIVSLSYSLFLLLFLSFKLPLCIK